MKAVVEAARLFGTGILYGIGIVWMVAVVVGALLLVIR